MDREKVVKGLEYHLKELSVGKTCFECNYCGDNPCEIHLITDALALLKDQEAVRVTTRRIPANGGSIVWTCGECGADLAPNNAKAKYCSACGRKVKWGE